VVTAIDAEYISRFVGERLMARGLLAKPPSLRRYSQGPDGPDNKLVFLCRGRPRIVVVVSPVLFPDVVAEECGKAAAMRSLLRDLGSPILEPLDTGRVQASTYAVLPYREPLSQRRGLSWIDRLRVRRRLFTWLLRIAQCRSIACDAARYQSAFGALARTITDGPAAVLLPTAEEYFASGRFAARCCPMHGDLWKGNVLRGAPPAPFTLVDWHGSMADGFPIFDLIRAAVSFGLSPRALQRQLQLHRTALGCQVEDLPIYLLGALGHYATHMGEMPLALFRRMADECVRSLYAAQTLTHRP